MKVTFVVILSLFPLLIQAQFLSPTSKADVYKSINEYRVEHGLQPLQVSKKLERSSRAYAFRVNIFQANPRHNDAWLNRNEGCGELLGASYRPIDGWKESYTHSQMLKSNRYTYMGAGKSGDTYVLRLR